MHFCSSTTISEVVTSSYEKVLVANFSILLLMVVLIVVSLTTMLSTKKCGKFVCKLKDVLVFFVVLNMFG